MNHSLLELVSISQTFTKVDDCKQKIFDKINLKFNEHQIVSILGKSGSGKSTLLRIIANLMTPTEGEVKYNFNYDNKSIPLAMVFQTAALFPWLTVLENVELGLEAIKVEAQERKQRAIEAINLIGLDGFESAYPRELSGGMKQRVGFARAIVVDPVILLMDEPFSALDVFTANTLKNDFLDLWIAKKTSLKSVILVTHSIEEAVFMSDRALILEGNRQNNISELLIDLKRPRNVLDSEFRNNVDTIYSHIAIVDHRHLCDTPKKVTEKSIYQKLPLISPSEINGLMDVIVGAPYNGTANLSSFAINLHVTAKVTLNIAEALNLLKLATVTDGVIKLNKLGKDYAAADIDGRKQLFAKHLLMHVPLAAYIRNVLHERSDHKAPKARFITHLQDHMSNDYALHTIKTIISWGRYAEIFSYDDNKKLFTLDNPTA